MSTNFIYLSDCSPEAALLQMPYSLRLKKQTSRNLLSVFLSITWRQSTKYFIPRFKALLCIAGWIFDILYPCKPLSVCWAVINRCARFKYVRLYKLRHTKLSGSLCSFVENLSEVFTLQNWDDKRRIVLYTVPYFKRGKLFRVRKSIKTLT
jgi:hypothetical protein